MTLKPVYESVDDVPEALREYYPEKEGKFLFVGVEGYKSPVEVDNLAKALSAERKTIKELKSQYEPWSSTFKDKTPAEIQAELDRIPILEESASTKYDKNKVEAMVETAARNRMAPVEKARDEFKAQVAERDATIAAFYAADRKRTILDSVREVAAKDQSLHETSYTSPRGALMLLAEQLFTIDETTNRVVVREDVEGIAAGLGVKDALAELKNQHPYLTKGSVGGGASGGSGGGSVTNPFKSNDMTERGKFAKQYPEKVAAMVKAAGLKSAWELHKDKH